MSHEMNISGGTVIDGSGAEGNETEKHPGTLEGRQGARARVREVAASSDRRE